MEWLPGAAAIVVAVIAVLGALFGLGRCRHPQPHLKRAVTHRDPLTGSDEIVEPASYICYECGKTWLAETRDPAWAPSGVRQSFRGYDPALAQRAATRAAIVNEQRKLLAANRARPTRTAPVAAKRRSRGKAWPAANVTDINSKRPA